MASRFGCVDPDRSFSATRNYRTVEDGFVSLDTDNTPFAHARWAKTYGNKLSGTFVAAVSYLSYVMTR
jgi:hypothetical protein